jgi:hypothetical protein
MSRDWGRSAYSGCSSDRLTVPTGAAARPGSAANLLGQVDAAINLVEGQRLGQQSLFDGATF